jgi:hypothetical protein
MSATTGTPIMNGDGTYGCNSAAFHLWGNNVVPDALEWYTDGYMAQITTTIEGEGQLANENRTICFMNDEFEFKDETTGLNGIYCHILVAGDEDYEYSG